jgi:hypothetical protein
MQEATIFSLILVPINQDSEAISHPPSAGIREIEAVRRWLTSLNFVTVGRFYDDVGGEVVIT